MQREAVKNGGSAKAKETSCRVIGVSVRIIALPFGTARPARRSTSDGARSPGIASGEPTYCDPLWDLVLATIVRRDDVLITFSLRLNVLPANRPIIQGTPMSRFRHVELQYASRLLNHGPTILITSYDAPSDRRNVMAATGQCRWNSPRRGWLSWWIKALDAGDHRAQWHLRHCGSRRRSRQLDLRRRQRQRPR